jgi:hypothetical protein
LSSLHIFLAIVFAFYEVKQGIISIFQNLHEIHEEKVGLSIAGVEEVKIILVIDSLFDVRKYLELIIYLLSILLFKYYIQFPRILSLVSRFYSLCFGCCVIFGLILGVRAYERGLDENWID